MTALRRLLIVVLFAFLFAPMGVIFVFSFFETSNLAFPPAGWTLKWYGWAITRTEFLTSLRESVALAALATIGASLLGIPAAMALARGQFRGRAVAEAMIMSPLLIPALLLGIGLLIYLSAIGVRIGFGALLIGHIVLIVPFVVRNVMVSLAGIPRDLEEAAAGLGATRWRTFHRVLLPLIAPGAAAGAILAFLISFDELAMTIFIASPNLVTMPVRIFNYVEWHLGPGLAALCSLLIGFTGLLIYVTERLRGIQRLL